MKAIHLLKDILKPNHFMTKLDLSDAYTQFCLISIPDVIYILYLKGRYLILLLIKHLSYLIMEFFYLFILWSTSLGLKIPITARFHHCRPKDIIKNNYVQ